MRNSAEIIVVGAGLAGLQAGSKLRAEGFDVLILEGSSQVGGRTQSTKFGPRIEEQGAEYLHPDHHPRMMQALSAHNLKICPEAPGSAETWLISDQGARLTSSLDPALIALCKKIDEGVSLISPEYWVTPDNLHLDRPFQDYVDELAGSPETREALLAWTVTLTGADPRSFSALGILRDFFMFGSTLTALTAAEYRIEGGTQSLADAIASKSDLTIYSGHPVIAVDAGPQGYSVSTSAGQTFQSSALILAVPFNVLSSMALPDKVPKAVRAESQRGHANRSAKYWFDAHEPYSDRISAAPPALAFMDATAAAGCIIADGALGAPDTLHEIFEAVDLPRKNPDDLRVHHWLDDPLARGAWMTIRPGQGRCIDQLWALGASNPNFQIGGGDITPIWPGWMEGALYAGEAMAARLIASHRP